jgi:hypothetical protein
LLSKQKEFYRVEVERTNCGSRVPWSSEQRLPWELQRKKGFLANRKEITFLCPELGLNLRP